MKITIQIVIQDHAREFEISETMLSRLVVGTPVKLDDIFPELQYPNKELSAYKNLLEDFEKMTNELTEASLYVGQIRKLDNEWTQVLIVEPIQTIDKFYNDKATKAKENLKLFFTSNLLIE